MRFAARTWLVGGLLTLYAFLALTGCGRAWALDPRRALAEYGRQVWTTENGLPQNTVLAVAQNADGFLWLRTEEGVVRFDGVEFRSFNAVAKTKPASEGDGPVRLVGGDGRVWLGGAGLRVEGAVLPLPDGMGAVRVLLEDREGTVWAGCDGGLARVAQGAVEVLRRSAVLALMEDREGSLWVGTEAEGLMELHEQPFVTYGVEEGLGGNVVRAVMEDAQGTVWVGTDGGGLSRRAGGRFVGVPGLSSNVVLALAGAANGDVWVGTPTGLDRIRDGRVRVFTAADGLADDYVRSVLVDRAGSVWVGTRHGLTRIAASGVMTNYTTLDGLGSDFIGEMVEGTDGVLWVGTSGGLTRGGLTQFDGRRFTNFTVKNGLVGDVVTAMFPGEGGSVWLGHDGLGLSLLKEGSDRRVGEGKLPETVFGILRDGNGAVWVSSRRGVYRWDGRAATAYDMADGLRVREGSRGGHPAAMRARDGTLWFAMLRGVSVVDPARMRENRVPPLVAVERVLVNDREVAATEEVSVPPGQRRVAFEYAGLSFVAPGKVRYRYRLEGFDPDWVEAGARRTAFYTNLRPGRYVFRVIAANNDGVWSERAAEVRLRLRPFFWETVWFYLLLLLAAGGAAYLVYAARVRRVEARYAGAMEERGRIAREIHDGLAQGIIGISLQLEVVGRLMGTSVEAAGAQLEAAKGMVRESLAEARKAIWELREDVGELPVRMGTMMHRVAGPMGTLEVTGTYRALEAEVEEELLRIAQEAVTNAVRHSRGTLVAARLVYEVGRLELTVRDDGRGFDPGAEVGRFGVRGMRERAEKIGGRLEVESGDGGTMVRVARPLL